jgi:cell shape-determining protein MreC
MKRNSYICVRTSVNENPATNFNQVAENLKDTKDFDQLIEQLKQSVTQARTK